MNVVYLEIEGHASFTPLAQHWFGALVYEDNGARYRREIMQVLTAAEAAELNAYDGGTAFSAGDYTNRFYYETLLMSETLLIFEEQFTDALLIKGPYENKGPQWIYYCTANNTSLRATLNAYYNQYKLRSNKARRTTWASWTALVPARITTIADPYFISDSVWVGK